MIEDLGLVEVGNALILRYEKGKATVKIFFLGFRILQSVFVKDEDEDFITQANTNTNTEFIIEFENLKGFDTIDRIKETLLPIDNHLINKE